MKKTSFSNSQSTVWGADVLKGTCVMYGVEMESVTPIICDVKLMTLKESDLGQLRAHYLFEPAVEQERRANAPYGPLGGDMVAVFGAEMSPRDAVTALRRLADEIEHNGLLIGADRVEDKYFVETVHGEVNVE